MGKQDIIALLSDVSEFLDNYIDVVDGDDGLPRPNKAMALQTDVDIMINTLERER